MVERIQQNLLLLAAPAAIIAAIGAAMWVPKWLEAKFDEGLRAAFAAGDPADDKLFCAMLVWAEEKYGAGTGAVKAKVVTDWIISRLPLKYRLFVTEKVRAKAEQFFQQTFDRLEATALKSLAENQVAPPQP